MNLRPHEADAIRRLLAGDGAPDAAADLAFLMRLDEEAPPLGPLVFRLECRLGGDARKEMDAVQKERKAIRAQLGKKRLAPGQGPPKPQILFAPTLNEYNAMEPWKKGDLCDLFDAEIDRRKRDFPAWSCGSIDRRVQGKGGKERTVREGGRKRIVVVTRESSVRPDELALDLLGGKIPIDRLVIASVLRGDSATWLARYCDWKSAPPGEGKVTIDVHEVGR
mgnify:CR=1 FL=1